MRKIAMFLVFLASSALCWGQEAQRQPNLLIDVSAEFLDATAGRPVNEINPIRDWIMDSCIYGTACTKGHSRVVLIPDACRASLDLVVGGVTKTSEAAYPVDARIVVYSNSIIPFEVRKRLHVDGEKLTGEKATACARVLSFFNRVCSLTAEQQTPATDLAELGFRENKWEGEQIGAAHARKKMSAELDNKLSPRIEEFNQFLKNVSDLVHRTGLTWEPLRWSTTSDRVSLRVAFATPSQPAASLFPPQGDADLSMRLHQSVFNEAAHRQLAGKTFTIPQLNALAERILGLEFGNLELSKYLRELDKIAVALGELGVLPSSITFAEKEPLRLEFRDGGVGITVRLASFKMGSKTYPVTQIKTRYHFDVATGGVIAAHRGGVEVEMFGSDGTLTPEAIKSMSKTLQEQIQVALKERFILPEFDLPGAGVGMLAPERADGRGGWLTVGWEVRRGARKR